MYGIRRNILYAQHLSIRKASSIEILTYSSSKVSRLTKLLLNKISI